MTLKEQLKQKSGTGVFQAVERSGTKVQSIGSSLVCLWTRMKASVARVNGRRDKEEKGPDSET